MLGDYSFEHIDGEDFRNAEDDSVKSLYLVSTFNSSLISETPVETLDLCKNIINQLKRAGINTLGDLINQEYDYLYSTCDLDPECVMEVLYVISRYGIILANDSKKTDLGDCIPSFENMHDSYLLLKDGEVSIQSMNPHVMLLFCCFGSHILMTDEEYDSLDERINKVLSSLTDREKRVLSLLFGFEGGVQYSLEETAREFNVTNERIRQIKAKALRKLRHGSRASQISKSVIKPVYSKENIELRRKVYHDFCDLIRKNEVSTLLDVLAKNNIQIVCEDVNEKINMLAGFMIDTYNLTMDGISIKIDCPLVYKELMYRVLYMYLFESIQRPSILLSKLSPDLIKILMMKGYLYLSDVEKDKDKLISDFVGFGLGNYSEELRNCNMGNELPQNILVYTDSRAIMDYFEVHEGQSLIQIIQSAKESNVFDLIAFISKLYSY